jgi:hypothetical protein
MDNRDGRAARWISVAVVDTHACDIRNTADEARFGVSGR